MIQTLPLYCLTLSTLNVRKTERDADIAALAEDIAARGLKQNLVAVPAHFSTAETDENYGDKFEVIAGGRRYQALRLLADAGRIEHDHPVPVMVEARGDAAETSLSENLHRVAMNPADEFEAFQTIVTQLQQRDALFEADAIALCAKRFGVTARHVEGRLRLATLAPDILNALRTGTIGLDSAKAYAGSTDHELQLKVFVSQCGPNKWKPHDPQTVRAELRGETVALDHPLARYIGIDAYRAAGGRSEFEMFMGTDGDERLLDVPLLERLATAKAEAALPALVKKQGWHDAVLARGTGLHARWPKEPTGFVKMWDGYLNLSDLKKAERKPFIAVVSITDDGDDIAVIGRFKPAVEQAEPAPGYVPPTDEERAAAERERDIDLWSARLAVGSFEDTPLHGKAFWHLRGGYVPQLEYDYASDDPLDHSIASATVAILVQVDAAAIAAARDAAIAKVDQLHAERAERQAAIAAQRAAEAEDSDDDDDGADED